MSDFCEKEMLNGYFDGLDKDSPEPSDNRSHSYRHGFRNGRDDLNRLPRDSVSNLRNEAAKAMELDTN